MHSVFAFISIFLSLEIASLALKLLQNNYLIKWRVSIKKIVHINKELIKILLNVFLIFSFLFKISHQFLNFKRPGAQYIPCDFFGITWKVVWKHLEHNNCGISITRVYASYNVYLLHHFYSLSLFLLFFFCFFILFNFGFSIGLEFIIKNWYFKFLYPYLSTLSFVFLLFNQRQLYYFLWNRHFSWVTKAVFFDIFLFFVSLVKKL